MQINEKKETQKKNTLSKFTSFPSHSFVHKHLHINISSRLQEWQWMGHPSPPPQGGERVDRMDHTCLPDVQGFSFHCSLCIQLPDEEKEQRYPPEREERGSSWNPQHPHGSAGQPHGHRTSSTVVPNAAKGEKSNPGHAVKS